MSQSLCACCLDPISPGHDRHGKILCDACESAWRTEFNRNLRHHLARLNGGFEMTAAAGKEPLPITAD